MIKKRFIAGALALCMIMAGTGYAYWADALNITTKATTGNLNVKFMDLAMYARYGDEATGWAIIDGVPTQGFVDCNYFQVDQRTAKHLYNKVAKDGSIDAYYKHADGYNDVKFSAAYDGKNGTEYLQTDIGDYQKSMNVEVDDNINISIDNMYPGYAQTFRTDIANVGNVAAKLADIDITTGKNDTKETGSIENMIGIALYGDREYCEEDNKTGNNNPVFKLAGSFSDDQTFTIGKVRFVRLAALKNADLSGIINASNENLLVVPSANRMDLYLGVAMDPDAKGTYTSGLVANGIDTTKDNLTMDKGVTIGIKLLWDQFNASAVEDKVPGNILTKQNNK